MKKHLAVVLGALSWLGGCGGGSPSLPPPPTPPALNLAPASLSFGVLVVGTESGQQVETLTNTGGSELAINSVAITGTNAADFALTNTCGSTLGAGASCTLSVTFTPSQLGPRNASITITDDAMVSSQVLSLNGAGGDSGPNATLSPTSLTLATQVVGTTSPAQSITLNNYGTMTLNIASIAASAGFGETTTCSSTLASGASCTINVTFTLSSSGSVTGTLSVTDNAPDSPQMLALNGLDTVVELDPTSLSFACVTLCLGPLGCHCDCSAPKTTTVTNLGSTAVSIDDITITGPFSLTNACPKSLPGSQSCTLSVDWSRSTGGGEILVNDNGGASPQAVSLSGNKTCSP